MAGFRRNSSTSPSAARAALIESEALRLRLKGLSYDDIVEELDKVGVKGATFNNVRGAVKRAMSRLRREAAESAQEVMELELARLDALFLAAMQAVTHGDVGAIDKAVKVMERRSKYLGLDAEAKVRITRDDGPKVLTPEQLAELDTALGKAVLDGEDESESSQNVCSSEEASEDPAVQAVVEGKDEG